MRSQSANNQEFSITLLCEMRINIYYSMISVVAIVP